MIEQATSVEEINRLEILLRSSQLNNTIFDEKLRELQKVWYLFIISSFINQIQFHIINSSLNPGIMWLSSNFSSTSFNFQSSCYKSHVSFISSETASTLSFKKSLSSLYNSITSGLLTSYNNLESMVLYSPKEC